MEGRGRRCVGSDYSWKRKLNGPLMSARHCLISFVPQDKHQSFSSLQIPQFLALVVPDTPWCLAILILAYRRSGRMGMGLEGNGRCAVAAKNVLLSLIAWPVHSVSCARAHHWASMARTHLHWLALLYSYTRQQQRCTSADSDGDRSPRHWKLSWEITCDRAFFKRLFLLSLESGQRQCLAADTTVSIRGYFSEILFFLRKILSLDKNSFNVDC